mmetsp:Transcript_5154/g.8275  ORF Transcript_5154/g.8275 Transcript_5154/m.8275 type:complete len:212 (-) Transcript_5154:558-1193(-)
MASVGWELSPALQAANSTTRRAGSPQIEGTVSTHVLLLMRLEVEFLAMRLETSLSVFSIIRCTSSWTDTGVWRPIVAFTIGVGSLLFILLRAILKPSKNMYLVRKPTGSSADFSCAIFFALSPQAINSVSLSSSRHVHSLVDVSSPGRPGEKIIIFLAPSGPFHAVATAVPEWPRSSPITKSPPSASILLFKLSRTLAAATQASFCALPVV